MSDRSPPTTSPQGGEADGKKRQKTYPKKASGQALQTVKRHSKPNELKLFGSCFWCVIFLLFLVLGFRRIRSSATTNKISRRSKLKLTDYSLDSPFVQRVWIALEVKGLNYQYIEVDPYKKPQSLLDINPRGLVPALKHGEYVTPCSSTRGHRPDDLSNGVGNGVVGAAMKVLFCWNIWRILRSGPRYYPSTPS